ncbi:cytosol aminopeptidase [Kurthia senegalensis]|uniref:cytosol aminopeptidase n=1 Tax=Kurthia senegalensis TaxID=1033740 RepID=UPI00028A28AA|nr:cytosol aminopeptidase [Kurthia senegalensis]
MEWSTSTKQEQVDIRIVGISRHQEQQSDWQRFEEETGLPLSVLLKRGDLDVSFGQMTFLPTATTRYVFVGLQERKQLTVQKMQLLWQKVGSWLRDHSYAVASIYLESFSTPQMTEQQTADVAISMLHLESQFIPNYQTFSNEADALIERIFVETNKPITLLPVDGLLTYDAQMRQFIALPPNLRLREQWLRYTASLCETYGATMHTYSENMLQQLGFGALIAAMDDVELVVYEASSTTAILCVVDLACDLLAAIRAVRLIAKGYTVICAIGTQRKQSIGTILTSISGKTIKIGHAFDAQMVALLDVMTFASMQQFKKIWTVCAIQHDTSQAFGAESVLTMTNQPVYITESDCCLHPKYRKVKGCADVVVDAMREGSLLKRGEVLAAFANIPWFHIEVPSDFVRNQFLFEQVVTKYSKED